MSTISSRAASICAVGVSVFAGVGLVVALGVCLGWREVPTIWAEGAARPSALLTVVNTNDGGAGSLRGALAAAAAGDTIQFSLPANSVIVLTSGQLTVTQAIVIDGSTATNLAVDGNSASRVFNVSAPLTIISLTVQHGKVAGNGGGINTTSALTLTNVAFLTNTTNTVSGHGGGLYALSTAVLTNVSFISNTATSSQGGGAYLAGAATLNGGLFERNSTPNLFGGWGGGLDVQSTLSLTGTQFLSNTAGFGGGGLIANSSGAAVALTNATFISNSALTQQGGGAYLNVNGPSTVSGGLFQLNSAPDLNNGRGGGLAVEHTLSLTGTQFLSNTAGDLGGGLWANSLADAVALTNPTFIRNSALTRYGGGAYLSGPSTVIGGSFQRNSAAGASGFGGALYAFYTLNLTGTQYLSNTAALRGGGLYANNATTLGGATFVGNTCAAASCPSGGWFAGSGLALTQFVTTSDDIQNQGLTTQAAGGVILFNGTGSQTIAGTGSTTFNDMWVANTGAGVSLGQDITVTNRLTLTSDLTTTGSYTLSLTVSATSAGTGDVWGRSDRMHAFSTGTTYPFGSPNVSVDFTAGTAPTEMTFDLTHTIPTGANFANAVTRFYQISPVGGSGFTATLRLHYQDSELITNTEGLLKLWYYPIGGPWTASPVNAFDIGANWAESNVVTSFSPWVLSQFGPAGPTAVALESFRALTANRGLDGEVWAMGLIGVLLGLTVVVRLARRR